MSSPVDPRTKGEVFANDSWFRWPAPCRICDGLAERRTAERRTGYESARSRERRQVERRSGSDRRQSDDGGPFALRITWGLVDGQVECIGVEVWSGAQPDPADVNHVKWVAHRGSPGPTPVRSLRDVKLGPAIRHRRHVLLAATKQTKKLHKALTDPDVMRDYGPPSAGLVAMIEEQTARFGARDRKGAPAGMPKRGRPRTADDVLWEVAHAYLEPPAGMTRTQAVQKLLDLADPRSAGKQINNAEEAGFLGPTSRGKVRGPGPRYGERPKELRADSAARRPTARTTTKKGRRDGKR